MKRTPRVRGIHYSDLFPSFTLSVKYVLLHVTLSKKEKSVREMETSINRSSTGKQSLRTQTTYSNTFVPGIPPLSPFRSYLGE